MSSRSNSGRFPQRVGKRPGVSHVAPIADLRYATDLLLALGDADHTIHQINSIDKLPRQVAEKLAIAWKVKTNSITFRQRANIAIADLRRISD